MRARLLLGAEVLSTLGSQAMSCRPLGAALGSLCLDHPGEAPLPSLQELCSSESWTKKWGSQEPFLSFFQAPELEELVC